MSSHHPPLNYKQVIHGLKLMGFSMRAQKATAHEQWEKKNAAGFYKVTVDKHLQPFGQMLIDSMSRQAGVSKKVFYQYCLDRPM